MKIIFTFIFTLTTAIAVAQKSNYVKTVDAFLIANEQNKVLPYLEAQLKQNPKNEELLRMLGFHNLQRNNLVNAEKYYREALTVNPKCARCDVNLGNIFAMKNDFKTALSHLEKAVKTDPKDASILITRARLKEMLGDGIGALSDYNKAVELEPENAQHYVQRGKYNMNSGYHALALADFNKAVALYPSSYSGYYYRSNVYFGQQKYNDALNEVNKAIELDPKQAELYISRGVIYNNLQDYDKTLTNYSKAIELNPNYFLAYLNRSKTYYALENLDASCTDLQVVKRLIKENNINDPELLKEIESEFNDYCDDSKASYFYQRGIASYNLNKFTEAIALYNSGLKKFPKNAMLLTFKGNALLASSANENALKSYQEALANKHTLLGELKEARNLENASEADAQKAYNATLADIHFGISTAKVNLNDFTEALNQINTAIKLKDGLQQTGMETYYNLRGNIYLAISNYEMAQSDFNKSISINKNYGLAYVNRAIAKASLVEKIKISSYHLSGKANKQPLQVVFASTKLDRKKTESSLNAALNDCNTAIEIDKNFGFAYYIRGQIKHRLNQPDYCIDLLTAKKLGLQVEPVLVKDCAN
ncbi:TPR repeat-containing protein YrrB [compost metagenome]